MIALSRSHGNYIARLRDEARRDTIHLTTTNIRKCEIGKHHAPKKGGMMVGRLWCCNVCKGAFQ